MIYYSTTMRGNPQHEDDPKKAYGQPQAGEVMNLDQFTEYVVQHNSKYDEADISAVLIILAKRLRELLLAGKKINLGTFGDFWITFNCKGAVTLEDFTENNITDVNVLFFPGKYLEDLRKHATFQEVPIRRHQAALMAAVDKGETVVDLTVPEEEVDDEP